MDDAGEALVLRRDQSVVGFVTRVAVGDRVERIAGIGDESVHTLSPSLVRNPHLGIAPHLGSRRRPPVLDDRAGRSDLEQEQTHGHREHGTHSPAIAGP